MYPPDPHPPDPDYRPPDPESWWEFPPAADPGLFARAEGDLIPADSAPSQSVPPELLCVSWITVTLAGWTLIGAGVLPANDRLLFVNLILTLAGFLLIHHLEKEAAEGEWLRVLKPALYLLTFGLTVLSLMFLNDALGIGSF